jgi:hypothetical protein
MFSDIRVLVAGGAIVLGVVVLVAALLSGGSKSDKKKIKSKEDLAKSYEKMMQDDVYHIFTKEFHEELRNKARLDFQKVINENAMFLQQDLRLTTSEINEYLKKEVSGKLAEEFAAYQQSIKDVQEAAVQSINTTVASAEKQQQILTEQIQKDVEARKSHMITNFEVNMAEIVSHYMIKTFGEQVDLKDQMPYILREMEAQKEAMKKDMML